MSPLRWLDSDDPGSLQMLNDGSMVALLVVPELLEPSLAELQERKDISNCQKLQ